MTTQSGPTLTTLVSAFNIQCTLCIHDNITMYHAHSHVYMNVCIIIIHTFSIHDFISLVHVHNICHLHIHVYKYMYIVYIYNVLQCIRTCTYMCACVYCVYMHAYDCDIVCYDVAVHERRCSLAHCSRR